MSAKSTAKKLLRDPLYFESAWINALQSFKIDGKYAPFGSDHHGKLTTQPGLADRSVFVVHHDTGWVAEIVVKKARAKLAGFYNDIEQAIAGGFTDAEVEAYVNVEINL